MSSKVDMPCDPFSVYCVHVARVNEESFRIIVMIVMVTWFVILDSPNVSTSWY